MLLPASWRGALVGAFGCLLALLGPYPGYSEGALTAERHPAPLDLLPRDYPRQRVMLDASQSPWRAIGRVSVLGGRSYCTGTLIAERYVLTAAHCLWRVRDFPAEVHFLAGFERDRYVAHAKARRLVFSPMFANPDSAATGTARLAQDFAIIELAAPIGQKVGYFHLAAADSPLDPDDVGSLMLVGYRSDRPYVQTAADDCRLTDRPAAEGLLTFICPIRTGDSGGPLLQPDGRGGYRLLAMTVGGYRRSGDTVGPTSLAANLELGLAISAKQLRQHLHDLSIALPKMAAPQEALGQ